MFPDGDDTDNDDVSMEDDIDDEADPKPFSSPSSSSTNPTPTPINGSVSVRRVATVSPSTDPHRRLFQRLWTDDDEISILEGFFHFTSQRGTTHHAHQHDTGPFYDQIKAKLQLDFTKSQLVEKLRRLKKKYRNLVSRVAAVGGEANFAFKTPHERDSYCVSHKIWGSAVKEAAAVADGEIDVERKKKRQAVSVDVAAVPVEVKTVPDLTSAPILALPGQEKAEGNDMVEETVRSFLGPLFKEMLEFAVSGGGGSLAGLVGKLAGSGVKVGSELDERWRKQQILELEVYSKRLELLQEQIKLTLSKLRSEER